uniref:Secreted protein n=1 Tax=Steinernema glaseri TaxID=37863 RepID=A0A1I8ALD0_9BILA
PVLDHIKEVLLGERVERQPQTEAVRQGNLVLDGLAGVQLAVDHLPVLVVALLFRHQVPTVGGGIQQNVVRRLLEGAVQHALEHAVVALPSLERQVIAEQHETLWQFVQLFHHPRQVRQVVTLDLDQAQPLWGVLCQQGTHQRRLAGAARAPQQRVVGRHAIDELAGIAAQLFTLPVDTDQVDAPIPIRRAPGKHSSESPRYVLDTDSWESLNVRQYLPATGGDRLCLRSARKVELARDTWISSSPIACLTSKPG